MVLPTFGIYFTYPFLSENILIDKPRDLKSSRLFVIQLRWQPRLVVTVGFGGSFMGKTTREAWGEGSFDKAPAVQGNSELRWPEVM